MKLTKENLIKLLEVKINALHNCSKLEEALNNEVAAKCDIAESAGLNMVLLCLKDESHFNDLCKIWEIKEGE